jgi:hypothetical protein
LVGTTAVFTHAAAPRANNINRLRGHAARKMVASGVESANFG